MDKYTTVKLVLSNQNILKLFILKKVASLAWKMPKIVSKLTTEVR